MAQSMCVKPQAALEAATEASAIVNKIAPKANGDVSPNAGAKEEAASPTAEKKNPIQVSNTKKPLYFYFNLAKRYIKLYNDVELSALGMAIPTLVTIAEILKANGVAVEKIKPYKSVLNSTDVVTSTVDSKDENKGRLVQKAKIVIVLERNRASKESEDAQSDESKEKYE